MNGSVPAGHGGGRRAKEAREAQTTSTLQPAFFYRWDRLVKTALLGVLV